MARHCAVVGVGQTHHKKIRDDVSITAAVGVTIFGVRPPLPVGADGRGLLGVAAAVAVALVTVWSILARLSSTAAGGDIDQGMGARARTQGRAGQARRRWGGVGRGRAALWAPH